VLREKSLQVSRLADQGLTFAPPPAWVINRDVPTGSDDVDSSVRYLLSDSQIDITGNHARSSRTITQARTSEGVNSIASVSISYLPSFQQLIIHRIRLLRGGTAIDLADPEGFQLLRREPNLERRMYDGALTADLQLSDVRPGDALETWFTIIGSNPALKGYFDTSLALAFSVPVAQTWVRLRAPSDRKLVINVRPDGSQCDFQQTEPEPGVTDREWRVQNEAPFVYDEAPLPWLAGHKRVNIDDELSWGQIADLFRPAYSPATELPADLEAEVRRIEAQSSSPAVRAIEALRFVQSSIRYLAVSIGASGFEPRPVPQIWQTRFGDCKDVSRLLASMLLRLGVKSCPALVSIFGKDPARTPEPHLYAFDHCIVRAEIDGVVRWLDGTQSGQGGDYARISQPPFEWALPLVENSDIERMISKGADQLTTETQETIAFGKRPTDPVEFTIDSIYKGWRADNMRATIRREGVAAVTEHWRKFYSNAYHGAEIAAPLEISDDLEANALRIVERYKLGKAWRVEENIAHFAYVDVTVATDLQVLPRPGRVQPLSLGTPRRAKRTTKFLSQTRWRISGWDERVEETGIKGYAVLVASLYSAKEFDLEVDYAITRDRLDPEHFDDFLAGLARLRRGAGVSLAMPVSHGEFVQEATPKDTTGGESTMGLGIKIFLAIAALGAIIRVLVGNPTF